MKKILYFVLIIFGITSYSQSDQTKLPLVAPVSPEAASLGKYGDIPVNLSTGRINYTIPIFTIEENGFELPIYLSYNHSGLLAEEDPGLVGLGWTLHAGGMIARQLRGDPDEGSLGYVGGDIGEDLVVSQIYNLWSNLPSNEIADNRFNLFQGAETGRLDTQPDKFVINAGNISGNFSYNELGEAIFYPQKNYVVTQNNGYSITDDKGIKYAFNELENTFSEPIYTSYYSEPDNPPREYVSGWWLTKIEFPTSLGSIDFDYDNGGSYFREGISESRSVIVSKIGNPEKCAGISANQINQSRVETTVGKKQISKITFSLGSILFDIRDTPINSLSRTKNYLHAITIKNKAGDTINSYEFVYDDLLSNFKLLKEIKKFGNDSNQIPFYQLEYNGKPPTSIFYAQQDSWGYYNGKQNTYLINGDRQIDFSKSSLGALTKINYPTQGYTEINYESNTVPVLEGAFTTAGQCFITPINASESVRANSTSDPFPSGKDILIKVDQIVRVRVAGYVFDNGFAEAIAEVKKTSGPIDSFECNLLDPCNIVGLCASEVTASLEGGGNVVAPNMSITSYFSVKANTVLNLSASAEISNQAYAHSRAILDYYDPDLITPEDNFVEVGGIRVSSTSDCSSSNDCISKNYKYISEEGITSGSILSQPVYSYKYDIDQVNEGSCSIQQFSSNSRIPLASFQGAAVLYNRVETLYNNDYLKGKTVKYFTSENNPSVEFPFPPIETKDWRKGNLLKEEIYKFEENELSLLKTVENIYETSFPFPDGLPDRKHSLGIVAGINKYEYIRLSDDQLALIQRLSNYTTSSYKNVPEFYQLVSTVTKDYSGSNELTSITTNTFENLTGYLKEQSAIDSKGSILKSVNTYPTIGVLVSENRLSEVIKQETYKNNNKISSQNTVYKDFNGKYLPEKIQVSKTTDLLENRLDYHDYDDNGNPLEISKSNGTRIRYIWGYDEEYPIAKLENFTESQLSTSIQALITDARDASNIDNDRTIDTYSNGSRIYSGNEGALREALDNLRTQLPNAMISTYTYDPLIGVTSMTDPRGYTMYYEYDEFNRLKQVKDANGNIMSQNEYHYKN